MTANRLALVLLAAITLTGCGRGALTAAGTRGVAELGALADQAGIDQQIAAQTVAKDENGTLVKRLPTPPRAKPVTLLTYKALDNNLGMLATEHMNTLERTGSTAAVNALAFVDDIGPNNTRRFYVRQDADKAAVTSPYEALGERDMGKAETLTEAIRWGFGSYPSQLRWLDVNSHGGGFKGIAQDDDADSLLNLPALGQALKAGAAGKPLDVVSFDACLMSTLEVAFELRGSVRYVVASEDESYALGFNVDRALASLPAGKAPAPDQLARQLVLNAQRTGADTVKKGSQKVNKLFYTVAALDVSKADRVAGSIDGLAKTLLAALPRHKAAIKQAFERTRPFYVTSNGGHDFEQRDLHELLDQLKTRVAEPAVQAAAVAANATLFNKNGIVVLSRSANEEQDVTRGIAIYAPSNGQVDAEYGASAFAKATRWDELLAALK